jgi:hypothetical protein
MGLLTRLYDFVDDGTMIAYGDQVDAELNQILAELNGNLDHSNLKANAGILGSQVAVAPNGLGTTNYNDNTVTGEKMGEKPNGAARININAAAIGEVELDYTDAKIPHMGNTGVKIARGRVLVEIRDHTSIYYGMGTVLFASAPYAGVAGTVGADDGNPVFTEAPRVLVTITSGAHLYNSPAVRNVAITGFNVTVLNSIDTFEEDITVDWIAIGK